MKKRKGVCQRGGQAVSGCDPRSAMFSSVTGAAALVFVPRTVRNVPGSIEVSSFDVRPLRREAAVVFDEEVRLEGPSEGRLHAGPEAIGGFRNHPYGLFLLPATRYQLGVGEGAGGGGLAPHKPAALRGDLAAPSPTSDVARARAARLTVARRPVGFALCGYR